MAKRQMTEQQRANKARLDKKWHADNPERSAELRHKAWLTYTLREKGFSRELYDFVVATQSGLCAVCKVEMAVRGQGPTSQCVDHHHASKTPRGLLCKACNLGLGYYENHQRGRIVIEPYEKYLDTPPASMFR